MSTKGPLHEVKINVGRPRQEPEELPDDAVVDINLPPDEDPEKKIEYLSSLMGMIMTEYFSNFGTEGRNQNIGAILKEVEQRYSGEMGEAIRLAMSEVYKEYGPYEDKDKREITKAKLLLGTKLRHIKGEYTKKVRNET
ncbi:MAG: hypothetical protein ABH835_03870 [Patescibacteria group bacterium]|nr:hypothetical protein [Patescibacteria group bacterium]